MRSGHGSRGPEELSEDEIDELVEDWKPEALVPAVYKPIPEVDYVTLKAFSPDGKHVTLEAGRQKLLNASSSNFLGLASSAEVKAAGQATLLEFSCGSCGPRGFYGTTTKHLELEASLAKFFGAKEAICYSGASWRCRERRFPRVCLCSHPRFVPVLATVPASTLSLARITALCPVSPQFCARADASSAVSSAIPAFCKRGDLLVVDEACNHIVRTGCNLSRSHIVWFKHNDMADLERVLQGVKDKDRKDDRSTTQRRYVVVEGLYANTGRVCPLPRVVELKKQCVPPLWPSVLVWLQTLPPPRGSSRCPGCPMRAFSQVQVPFDPGRVAVVWRAGQQRPRPDGVLQRARV